MKRFAVALLLLPVVSAAAVSCAKENLEVPGNGSVMASAVALGQPQVKSLYGEDSSSNLNCTWQEGDVVFGFKEDGTPFEFAVESVASDTGTAVLKQNGTTLFSVGEILHSVFCPGKTSADLRSSTLAVDFSEQSDEILPSLMICDAVITEGPSVVFSFEHAVSVVGLTGPVMPTEATEGKCVVRVALSGHEIASSGVVSVSDGKITFNTDAPSNFIVKTVNREAVAVSADSYTIVKPVYVAVPAGKVEKLSVIDNKNGFFEYGIGKTAAAGKYYRISGKTLAKVDLPAGTSVATAGVEWSKSNLGGTSPTSAGNLYRWSDTGIIYTSATSSTIVGDESHSGGFIDYVGEIYCSEAGVYTKYNSTDAVLEPVDDIVQLTYPGSGWRMPTVDEFKSLTALKDNSEYEISLNGDNFVGVKYTRIADGASVVLRGNQPCSNSKAGTAAAVNIGRYWTSCSTTDASKSYAAQYFCVVISNKVATGAFKYGIQKRYFGYSVRPVKPV